MQHLVHPRLTVRSFGDFLKRAQWERIKLKTKDSASSMSNSINRENVVGRASPFIPPVLITIFPGSLTKLLFSRKQLVFPLFSYLLNEDLGRQ